jgi:anti-sigma-K factor RskA
VSEHREEHLDLCAAYALGNLEPAERARLEEHLDHGCPTCEAALTKLSEATVLLAASAPAAQPSPALREKVLAAIRAEPRPVPVPDAEPRRRSIPLKQRQVTRWTDWAWGAVAAAMALASALLVGESNRLRAQLEDAREELQIIARRLAEEERLNEVLSAPGARVAVLELTPAGVQALRARVTYDPKTRSAVVVFENFSPPAGHDYELWAIRDAAPASLGLIKVDDKGNAVMRITDAGDPVSLQAFAVSLEPTGGSPNKAAPSGPVVMLGKLGG